MVLGFLETEYFPLAQSHSPYSHKIHRAAYQHGIAAALERQGRDNQSYAQSNVHEFEPANPVDGLEFNLANDDTTRIYPRLGGFNINHETRVHASQETPSELSHMSFATQVSNTPLPYQKTWDSALEEEFCTQAFQRPAYRFERNSAHDQYNNDLKPYQQQPFSNPDRGSDLYLPPAAEKGNSQADGFNLKVQVVDVQDETQGSVTEELDVHHLTEVVPTGPMGHEQEVRYRSPHLPQAHFDSDDVRSSCLLNHVEPSCLRRNDEFIITGYDCNASPNGKGTKPDHFSPPQNRTINNASTTIYTTFARPAHHSVDYGMSGPNVEKEPGPAFNDSHQMPIGEVREIASFQTPKLVQDGGRKPALDEYAANLPQPSDVNRGMPDYANTPLSFDDRDAAIQALRTTLLFLRPIQSVKMSYVACSEL